MYKFLDASRELNKLEQILDIKGKSTSIFKELKDKGPDYELKLSNIDYVSIYEGENINQQRVVRVVFVTKDNKRYYTATERVYEDLSFFMDDSLTLVFFIGTSRNNGQPFLNYYVE